MPTKIEWCDETWNPITGCTKLSEGCENCYAEKMAKRLKGRYGYDIEKPFEVTFHPDKLKEPFRWATPRRIFVCSMGDIFHGEVRVEWIDEVLKVISQCSHHTFMVLTKRPGNIYDKLYGEIPFRFFGHNGSMSNLWIGVTGENQNRVDERMKDFDKMGDFPRFISIEPMIGSVDLRNYLEVDRVPGGGWFRSDWRPVLDWVIVGGETGPRARPMNPEWVRLVRDQCVAAGVPFFFKGWGEWAKRHDLQADQPGIKGRLWHTWDPDTSVCRVGKKAAGRMLDGREWNEFPTLNKNRLH